MINLFLTFAFVFDVKEKWLLRLLLIKLKRALILKSSSSIVGPLRTFRFIYVFILNRFALCIKKKKIDDVLKFLRVIFYMLSIIIVKVVSFRGKRCQDMNH